MTPPPPCGCFLDLDNDFHFCNLHANAERLRDSLEMYAEVDCPDCGGELNEHEKGCDLEALLTSCREKGG